MAEVYVNHTENYYKCVSSASELMDNELTVSHLFRSGRFTKAGVPYGRVVAGRLGIPSFAGVPRILEVGPGLGDVAQEIINALEKKDFHYTFADISYDAVSSLKRRFRGGRFSFITNDFLKEKLSEKFDYIICNEVLADFPTVVNMTSYKPKIRDGDTETYFDALALAKFYGLSFVKPGNFNYGAVKFLEKARASLADGGKMFVCEHASSTPQRIGVFGHAEYTIDFAALAKVAEKLRFRSSEGGCLTELLKVQDKKAVIFYTQPELKMLYNFFKEQGTLLDQKPYDVAEAIAMLEQNEVHFYNKKAYASFLGSRAKSLRAITGQFEYLILGA